MTARAWWLRHAGWATALAVLLLVLFFNKTAYRCYFSDDDLDNITLSRTVSWREWTETLISLQLSPDNYRPVGQAYYRAAGSAFGLHYAPYVATLQIIHLCTVALLWVFLRRGGMLPWPAAVGTLVYAFHAAALPAYWKPMYVFDLLCGLLVMLTLVFWQRGRWGLAFAAFWLAYKSKEMALFLPPVLLLYDVLLATPPLRWGDTKRWARLIPFFLVSLSFGLQAVFRPVRPNNDYTMHFSVAVLASCATFYAGKVLFFPASGFVLSAVPLFLRRRWLWFGLLTAWLLLTPMLFLPGRQMGAYLYIPLLGLAIAAADLTAWQPRIAAAVLAFWLAWNYAQLRNERRPIIAMSHANRAYVTGLERALQNRPKPTTVVFEGAPSTLGRWGVEGAIRYLVGNNFLPIWFLDEPSAKPALRSPQTLLLSWEDASQSMIASARPEADLSYIHFREQSPVWQMEEGWYAMDSPCRWVKPYARLRLQHPAAAVRFFLKLYLGERQLPDRRLRISLDGEEAGSAVLQGTGGREFTFPLKPQVPPGTSVMELRVEPGFYPTNGDPRLLAVQVCECGFLP